jgi:hypothetical protein
VHPVGRRHRFPSCRLEHDLEGIVAKWKGGTYQHIARTSWLKIRNAAYMQWDGRRELFEGARDNRPAPRAQGAATSCFGVKNSPSTSLTSA